MISVFSCYDAYTKTKLLHSFCLSLYGSCFRKASAAELHHLEVIITFNNVLRKSIYNNNIGKGTGIDY